VFLFFFYFRESLTSQNFKVKAFAKFYSRGNCYSSVRESFHSFNWKCLQIFVLLYEQTFWVSGRSNFLYTISNLLLTDPYSIMIGQILNKIIFLSCQNAYKMPSIRSTRCFSSIKRNNSLIEEFVAPCGWLGPTATTIC